MGENIREALKLRFDKRLRLEFHGARITSDAGLLACRNWTRHWDSWCRCCGSLCILPKKDWRDTRTPILL